MNGILLSTTTLSRLSDATRTEIFEAILEDIGSDQGGDADDQQTFVSGATATDLDTGKSRQFLSRCADKTKLVLIEILKRPQAGFLISDVARSIGEAQPGRLRGVWGGLTKRVRTITGDGSAQLFTWTKQGPDWHGQLASTTYANFKTLLLG